MPLDNNPCRDQSKQNMTNRHTFLHEKVCYKTGPILQENAKCLNIVSTNLAKTALFSLNSGYTGELD